MTRPVLPPTPSLDQAVELLTRRPRLIPVLLAVQEMIDGKRNCRISIDVVDGSVRLFRETQERAIPLIVGADLGPTG